MAVPGVAKAEGADVSSDFLVAAQGILSEYGEPGSVLNRSGTVTATAVQVFKEDGIGNPAYWGEAALNAEADALVTIYLSGNVTISDGYSVALVSGTYGVNALASYKEGTTTALHVARSRKL